MIDYLDLKAPATPSFLLLLWIRGGRCLLMQQFWTTWSTQACKFQGLQKLFILFSLCLILFIWYMIFTYTFIFLLCKINWTPYQLILLGPIFCSLLIYILLDLCAHGSPGNMCLYLFFVVLPSEICVLTYFLNSYVRMLFSSIFCPFFIMFFVTFFQN